MSTSERKLNDNEKSVYRKVFLDRTNHGTTVEAADRQALHAVNLWNVRGALNDDRPDPRDQEIERLRDVVSTYETAALKLSLLSAMLGVYGLPDEPKALAKQIEWLRKTNADELQRLHAGFVVVREILCDDEFNFDTNSEALHDHLGEFVTGAMSAEALREQFYSPDSGPRADTDIPSEVSIGVDGFTALRALVDFFTATPFKHDLTKLDERIAVADRISKFMKGEWDVNTFVKTLRPTEFDPTVAVQS